MSPLAHVLLSWLASGAARLPKRNRLLTTYAGAAPDLDGLGVLVESVVLQTNGSDDMPGSARAFGHVVTLRQLKPYPRQGSEPSLRDDEATLTVERMK